MSYEDKKQQCNLCNYKCPPAEMAKNIAEGRMYTTRLFIDTFKKINRAIGKLETLSRDAYNSRKYEKCNIIDECIKIIKEELGDLVEEEGGRKA